MANSPEASSPSMLSDLSLSACRARASNQYYLILKRIIDVVAVLVTLPIWLPLIGVLAFMVRLDGGKAFFSQPRVGRGGRVFTFWKLRSMIPDADRQLEEYLAQNSAARLEWNETQKLKNDPRVTPIGQLLRSTSADELPQLWNVLIGDMSLVGPRPMLPEEVAAYEDWHMDRLEVPPGITGLWQVKGRSDLPFDDYVRLDLFYIENWSVGYD